MAKSEDVAMPQSVEEAGALLGAVITRYGKVVIDVDPPPTGMSMMFAVISPVPSSELLYLLHTLRSLLRSAPKNEPLIAAPSLLAGVLMKLLGISSSLAASYGNTDPSDVPPMLSTPLRRVWVECVVLCHSLGEGLSGAQRINLYGFVRDMIILAGLNPRTARALGGSRIAALEVISGVLEDPKLSTQLASWAFDVVKLCQRALKSSGNGEPTYRIAAIQAVSSVVVASRTAYMKTRSISESAQFMLKGALEDKAIFEMVKLLKIAVQDKFPEVRSEAARLACLLGPLAINVNVRSPISPEAQAISPTICLEEIMTLAFKNLDDESADVSGKWAEALARCMCTSIEFKSQIGSERGRGEDSRDTIGSSRDMIASGRGGKKGILPASVCSTLPKAIKYLVSVFIKVGGELAAPRAGGNFSLGGRAVRVGFARSIIYLLRLQLQIESIGEGRSISYKETILIILAMLGNDLIPLDRGAPTIKYLDATTVVTSRIASSSSSLASPPAQTGRNLFGQGPKISHADGCIARLLTNRVLRDGLAEQMTEITQLTLLHELVDLCTNKQNTLKGNQLQVILVEISHLFATLGEATASSLEEIVPALLKCLRHLDHGVRYEAAVACAAMASVFPLEGHKIVRESINKIQLEYAELMSIANSGGRMDSTESTGAPRFRFGRNTPVKKEVKIDETLKHQYTIHGMALMVSVMIRDLPDLPGGLPTDLLDATMSVSEILVSSLTNDILKEGSPSSTCTCVRAGFCLISGALTTGPTAISNQIAFVFGLWQNVCKSTQLSSKFTADHEMMCVEAMLTSIVAFLKFCAELLLSIPDALSRTSLILENLLPLFFSKGRLGSVPVNPAAACRLDSAKASIMEAFAWLPPGSFPMIADSVFGFAASHIQSSIQNDVGCSVLPSLISKEDAILDAVSFGRATKFGQVGGARDLEKDLIALTSEVAHHGDRESAFSFLGTRKSKNKHDNESFLKSQVLGLLHSEKNEEPATVLHEVGTWKPPVDPNCATKIRLVDAAVQAFAATFALRSGKEQHNAMDILQSLLPPIYFQNARMSADQDRAGKYKDNLASAKNIAAVLLSCVKSLPLDESTHDIPIGLGPTWMKKASSILISILPSSSNEIRRAAAEGLAFLATLGIKSDMRFLQSAVLHSLDEVVSRNQSQGQGRNAVQDDSQNGRSGGLLALACIQRNTHRIKERRACRSRLRGSPSHMKDHSEDSLPTIQIMTRVLPYATGHLSSRVSLNSRASALHAFLMLLEYSGKLECEHLSAEDLHLLRKVVEIVENNFLSSWTIASHVLDQGNETEKIAFESSFLSVLLRFMTFLIPSLHHLEDFDFEIARRFSTMAVIIMECRGDHPVVQFEALAFFEVLADNQDLLPVHDVGLKYDENPILSCIPSLLANITPDRLLVLPRGTQDIPQGCHSSFMCLRATIRVLQVLSASQIFVARDMRVVSLMFDALEGALASVNYSGETYHRGLASSREAEISFNGGKHCVKEVSKVLLYLLYLERALSRNSEPILLRYILLSQSIITRSSISNVDDDDEYNDNIYTFARVAKAAIGRAASDSQSLFELASPIRWQVKVIAVQMITIALVELATNCRQVGLKLVDSQNFNPKLAKIECSKACNDSNMSNSDNPGSFLALHIPELVTGGCVVATATVDQAELRILQENSMHCLVKIIDNFGAIPDPDESHRSVLSEYVPQLSSCIKSSLSAPDEKSDELTCRLFWAGCKCLRSFLRSQITDDIMVLKRLIRPVVVTEEEVPFFNVRSNMPGPKQSSSDEPENLKSRSNLMVKIGKIWMIGNIPSENPEIDRLQPESLSIGVHAAALAIDGAKLLLQSNLSLCGHSINSPASNESNGFFSFRDICDIDNYTKAALAKTWANSAQLSVKILSVALASSETSDVERKGCLEWLELIVPYLFSGLYDAIKSLNDELSSQDAISWAKEVDVYEIACCCLTGINTLAKSPNLSQLGKKWKREIESSTDQINKYVFLPAFVISKSPRPRSGKYHTEGMVDLVIKSCELFKTFSRIILFEDDSDSCPFLFTVLSPLNLLERKEIALNGQLESTIISACLISVGRIIELPASPSTLVKAMLSLVISLSTRREKALEIIDLASQELLKKCLYHESATTVELAMVTLELAKSRNWTAWTSVVKIKDGIAAEKSLLEIKTVLLNPYDMEEQLNALGAIRSLIHSVPPPNPLAGRILSAVGAEFLSIFQAYGTLSNSLVEIQSRRAAVCADSMKIALSSYQQFSSDFSEQEITEFLIVLFEVFIAVLRFNGLPNHPPPQGVLSDPSIGRMCAQAITHVARTTPVPFKASIGGISEHDQVVLEFAVRCEMSGYAVATAPVSTKKKLSLAGFKK